MVHILVDGKVQYQEKVSARENDVKAKEIELTKKETDLLLT